VRVGWLALPVALGLAGCAGSCGDEKREEAKPACEALPAPEAWTFGAMRAEAAIALPPGCNEREPPLRAVLPRDTRFAAEPSTLGRLWVAEGAYGGALRGEPFEADTAGVVTFAEGPTRATPAPWPALGAPALARSEGAWVLAVDRASHLVLWRDGVEERAGAGLTALELACDGGRCALLVKQGSALEVWIGGEGEAVLAWQRVGVPAATFAVAIADGDIVASAREEGRARLWRVRGGEVPADLGAIEAGAGVLAVAAPSLALSIAPAPLVDGCPEEGGVLVAPLGGHAQRLRSPQPAVEGRLHRAPGGLFATWRAPTRCGARTTLLYAARLDAAGAVKAPVTTVGTADAYAVATDGADLDLWLEDRSEHTLSWIRARCSPL
jgi:hypothetical protein